MIRHYMFFCMLVSGLIFLSSGSCYANEFHVKGYTVDVMWKVKKEKLIVWGDVEDGKYCRQISLSIRFNNSKKSGSVVIRTSTKKEHNPKSRSPFRGERSIGSKKYKNNWFVDDIYLKCLK